MIREGIPQKVISHRLPADGAEAGLADLHPLLRRIFASRGIRRQEELDATRRLLDADLVFQRAEAAA